MSLDKGRPGHAFTVWPLSSYFSVSLIFEKRGLKNMTVVDLSSLHILSFLTGIRAKLSS